MFGCVLNFQKTCFGKSYYDFVALVKTEVLRIHSWKTKHALNRQRHYVLWPWTPPLQKATLTQKKQNAKQTKWSKQQKRNGKKKQKQKVVHICEIETKWKVMITVQGQWS